MPEIKVTKRGGYKYGDGAARKHYGYGEKIIAKQKDARMLVAAKLAEYVGDEKAETKTAPKAQPAKAAAPKAAASKKVSATRSYNRRDLKAKA